MNSYGTAKRNMQYFKDSTLGSVVVMGSTTFKSLQDLGMDNGLPNRFNYVLSSKGKGLQNDKYVIIQDITALLDMGKHRDVWCIGGASVYEQFKDVVSEVHWTTIHKTFEDADTFFNMSWVKDESVFKKVKEEKLCDLATVRVYKRK